MVLAVVTQETLETDDAGQQQSDLANQQSLASDQRDLAESQLQHHGGKRSEHQEYTTSLAALLVDLVST